MTSHQWMFVTDTTDAAYPPEDFLPESIMDRLSEILSEHKHSGVRFSAQRHKSKLTRRPNMRLFL